MQSSVCPITALHRIALLTSVSPVIRTQAALDSFSGHKVTLGSEIGVAAGPYGSGAALEVGVEKSPVLSYIRTRGAYAGVEAVAQVFVERKEENELQYSCVFHTNSGVTIVLTLCCAQVARNPRRGYRSSPCSLPQRACR